MKAGNFNINDYLEKLYEEAEEETKQTGQTGFMDGGEGVVNSDGIVIPDTNKKSYDWLKKEFQKGKVEVKVEMNIGGAKFEPGYDLQTDLKSVKDFKPGMFGEIRTADTKSAEGDDKKPSLDAKKDKESFQKGEGEAEKKELPKTKASEEDIKDKKEEKVESEEKEKKEESEEKEEKEKNGEEPEVKKIDLKTKKK